MINYKKVNSFTKSARSIAPAMICVFASAVLSVSAQASINLVVNGSFEQTLVPGRSAEFGGRFPSQQVTGWATNGYNFVITPGTVDIPATYASSEYGIHDMGLWGPNNGSNNGLPASSPDGGNFLAMDGAYMVEAVSQTINGLTAGADTTVSFYWAGAQQHGYNGATTEQFEVSLGSQHRFTPVLNDPGHGFTGWQAESFNFTPTSSSEVLSFLAIGTPGGQPPFSLLDGVSVMAPSPEPGYFAMLGLGLAGAMGICKRYRKAS